MDAVKRIADAVLYEGYLLWPYRKSAMKNQRRWTFGGVYPEGHTAAHPDDRAAMQTQCLARGDADCRLEVRVRFLHVVKRDLVDAAGGSVEELVVDGRHNVAWDEATEREIVISEPGQRPDRHPGRSDRGGALRDRRHARGLLRAELA